MKNVAFLFLILLSTSAFAQNAKLTITISYAGIVEGYDHVTRDQIFIDDVLIMTTEEHLESEPLTVTIKVNKGDHKVRVVNWNQYEGNWEEKTKENGYSVDGFFTSNYKFKKKNVMTILHDLDDAENSPIVHFK